ncbi:MAG: hypothetical protein HY738_03755, partial [Bacteroidia bacterium]|nr:hypothetical protein [Bacteroidia bacterium]
MSAIRLIAQDTLVVTKIGDPNPFTDPYNFVDSLCDPDMYGTLQWAFYKANDLPGATVIIFDIQGVAPYIIFLNQELPGLYKTTVIDGTTQAGYATGSPAIVIDGQDRFNMGIFSYATNNSNIKGLYLRNFRQSAIIFSGCATYNIVDNVICRVNNGADNTATSGILLGTSNYGSIKGNIIGTDNTGAVLSIEDYGIAILYNSEENTIGGTISGEGNTIVNCGVRGISVFATCNYNRISGNLIYNNPVGIRLLTNANMNKTAPVITDFTGTTVTGTSQPGDIIELFGSTGDENANEYLTTVTADEVGNWTANITTGYGFVVATATDAQNNTSALCLAKPVALLPLILSYNIEQGSENVWFNIVTNVYGGAPPYTFAWSNDSTTTQLFNILPGRYSVTVTDITGQTATAAIDVLLDVAWTDLENTSWNQSAKTITKTGSGNGWNAGAASENILKPGKNGFLQYKITQQNFTANSSKERVLGFSEVNQNANYTSIQYGFYFALNQLNIAEFGIVKGSYGVYAPGDVFEIWRQGDKIRYYKNNILLYESVTDTSKQLMLDASLKNAVAYFDEVKTSLCPGLHVTYTSLSETPSAKGSITLNITGGEPPYHIMWGQGELPTLADIELLFDTIPGLDSIYTPEKYYNMLLNVYKSTKYIGLTAGVYRCKIYDNSGSTKELMIPVSKEINYVSAVGVEIVNNLIVKTGADGWGNSKVTLYNILSGNQEGTLGFSLTNTDIECAVGLRNVTKAQSNYYTGFDYGLYIKNGKLKVVKDGQAKNTIGWVKPYENIEYVIDTNSNLMYIVNGIVLYTQPIVADNIYVTDILIKECPTCGGGVDYQDGIEIVYISKGPSIPEITASTTDATACNSNDGTIDLTIGDYSADLSITGYEWHKNGSDTIYATTKDITNLSPGIYTITIGYSYSINYSSEIFQGSIIRSYYIGYDQPWTMEFYEPGGVEQIICPDNSTVSLVAGKTSPKQMGESEPGWAEISNFIPSGTINVLCYGFSDKVSYKIQDMKYGFFLYLSTNSCPPFQFPCTISATINVVSNGQIIVTDASLSDLQYLRIERLADMSINLYANDVLIHTFVNTPPAQLMVKAMEYCYNSIYYT